MNRIFLLAALALAFGPCFAAQVSMSIEDDWNQGFTAKVVIDNTNGTAPVTDWQLSWAFDRTIVNMWNASFVQSGQTIEVSNAGWNATVAVGSRVEFGFQGAPGNITVLPPVTLVGGGNGGGGDPEPGVVACGVDPSTLPGDDDWLTSSGNQLVDQQGNPVWVTGANWFGFNTSERVFHGLWSVNLEKLVEGVAERGINLLRVPIGTEIMKEWKAGVFKPTNVNLSTNPGLQGKSSLEIFDRFLAVAKACGVKVMLDVHHPDQNNSGHTYWGWAKGDITVEDFYDTWEWFAERYKNDDTIVAFDLQNEPHGVPNGSLGNDIQKQPDESWEAYCTRKPASENTDFAKWDGSEDANNWRHVAQTAARRILAVNPNALIVVEGIEVYPRYGKWINNKSSPVPGQGDQCYDFNWWGGNLRGVRDFEVEVPGHQAQIIYSPHDYGPLVFQQPWFEGEFDRNSLRAEVWEPNWLYIHNDLISPLLIGEWGGFMDGGDNQKWMEALRDEIVELRLHHTFWAINPNSGDTGGLLQSDWLTWDEEKYNLLKPALWQTGQGKFIGLDHRAKLGGSAGTGVSLGDLVAQ